MATVHVAGKLGRDAELRYTQRGDPFLTMSLAESRRPGDGDETEWWNVLVWGSPALLHAEALLKGMRVTVSGRLQVRMYEHEGTTRLERTVHAEEIGFSGKAKAEA